MAGKQQRFICHSSGSWKAPDEGAGSFVVSWDPPSWFIDGCLVTVLSHGRWDEEAVWGLLYKGTHAVNKGTALMT